MHFDRDPGWEGFNNRLDPNRVPTVTQDFGYTPTNFASKAVQKAEGAQFDRFGLFSTYPGGQLVRVYLDDLKYTASRLRNTMKE